MARSLEPVRPPGLRTPGVLGQAAARTSAGEVIRRVSPGDIVLEDYRPLPLNLEWRLSELYWIAEGVRPFITDAVPYAVNNDGASSAAAASVLFANCVEAAPGGEGIHVLEVGAGTALFARYLLDQFRDLCRRDGRDFYDRLVFHVTDRSAESVRHWNACGIFADHAAHVRTAVCDAETPALTLDRPLRAVFANYVLDSLPAAVLRRSGDTLQQLCARATVRDDAATLMGFGQRADWMRQAARADRTEALAELLPLLPVLDAEMAFLPISSDGARGWDRELTVAPADVADGAIVVYNYGALRCLDSLLPRLDAAGFLLIRDYGNTVVGASADAVGAQRFGGATAVPVDFVSLERHLRERSIEIVGPGGDGPLHTRLVGAELLAGTRRTFVERFTQSAPDTWTLPALARQYAEQGLLREALDVYRLGIDRAPRDWRLLGEAARFVSSDLRDPQAGLELARAALQLNPWYSPLLWNVLGDCLAALDRADEAHECYEQSRQLHPAGVESHLRLARSWLRLGDPARSLEAVAHGLASDTDDMHRHHLLESQQAAVDALSRARIAQRETTFRRRARTVAVDPTADGTG
jgi:putative S-adenosyl-L-methionine-dependent methyltransferase